MADPALDYRVADEAGSSISLIVPVHNAGAYLPRTLPVLQDAADELDAELVVVNDGSSDDSLDIARRFGIHVIDTGGRRGAARSRNIGVEHARGDILVFADADVAPRPGSIGRLLAHLSPGGYAAAFGSYDAECPERNFTSRYQNLRHHYYHQHGGHEAESFWCGLGVVKRSAFVEAGGFDPDYEGIEDVELGARLRRTGHRIRLDPDCRGTHLKRWTLTQALHTDILKRALPWSRLLSRPGAARPTLNTGSGEMLRAAGAQCLLVTSVLALAGLAHGLAPTAAGLAVGALNLPFLKYVAKREGAPFAIAATLYHQLYYLYSSTVFVYCRAEASIAGRLFKTIPARDKAGAAGK